MRLPERRWLQTLELLHLRSIRGRILLPGRNFRLLIAISIGITAERQVERGVIEFEMIGKGFVVRSGWTVRWCRSRLACGCSSEAAGYGAECWWSQSWREGRWQIWRHCVINTVNAIRWSFGIQSEDRECRFRSQISTQTMAMLQSDVGEVLMVIFRWFNEFGRVDAKMLVEQVRVSNGEVAKFNDGGDSVKKMVMKSWRVSGKRWM